jgi:hypothetical protein
MFLETASFSSKAYTYNECILLLNHQYTQLIGNTENAFFENMPFYILLSRIGPNVEC